MQAPPEVPVRISRDGLVVDRVAKVRSGRGESVRWIAQDGGGPWTITFDKVSNDPSTYPIEAGSPFRADRYQVGPGGSGSVTGPPVNGLAERTYRYRVSGADGVTDDPDIDIES